MIPTALVCNCTRLIQFISVINFYFAHTADSLLVCLYCSHKHKNLFFRPSFSIYSRGYFSVVLSKSVVLHQRSDSHKTCEIFFNVKTRKNFFSFLFPRLPCVCVAIRELRSDNKCFLTVARKEFSNSKREFVFHLRHVVWTVLICSALRPLM